MTVRVVPTWIVASVLATAMLSGCERISKVDASNSTELWGGYAAQAIYRVKEDIFLVKLDDDWEGHRYALSPEGRFRHPNRFYSVPISVEQYKQKRGQISREETISGAAYQVPTTVIGVVEAGARIRCIKLLKYYQWTWFFGEARWTMVFAEILDGQYAGTLTDVTDLSVRIKYEKEHVAVYDPIPQLLRRANGENKQEKVTGGYRTGSDEQTRTEE